MNTNDFLQLSKRNIFHTFIKCKDESDSKYILNYAPSIIVEFNDDELDIKDFNTRKSLLKIKYTEMVSISLSVCSRLIAMRFAPTKMYDIEYIIKTDSNEFHFECKNPLIWKEILKILNNHHVSIIDPLFLVKCIENCDQGDGFYDFCQKNIASWKEKYNVLDPKVGDSIRK